MTSETVDAYQSAWEPIPDKTLAEAAVQVSRSDREFFPPPGVVYQAALDLMDDSPNPEDAWAVALQYAKTPYFLKPGFELPERVRKVLRGMGDPGQWEEAKYGMYRSQFQDAYRQETARWRTPERKLLA